MMQDEGQRTRIGAKPTIILVVGVNGVGKTTTIGKLANYFHLFKYKVMLAAGRHLPRRRCRTATDLGRTRRLRSYPPRRRRPTRPP